MTAACSTVTRTLASAVPPDPVATAVYVVEFRGLITLVPEPGTVPMPPSRVTEDAFSDFHVRVVDCPLVIVDGDADRDTFGVGGGAGLAGGGSTTLAAGCGTAFLAQLEL